MHMKSITKNHQSLQTLRAMVERAYGPGQVPVGGDFATELSYGLFNVAYRVRLRDGSDVVVKIAPPAQVPVLTREHLLMRNEIAAMDLIQRSSGVPIPRVDFSDLSRDLCDADYFFMEYIDALCFGIAVEAGELAPDVVVAGFEDLGRLNKDLNAIVGPHFGPLQGPGFATWREAATTMFGDVLSDGEAAEVDLGWEYGPVRDAFAEQAHVLDDVVIPRLVEVDLWAKNSMIRDGRIVAIIDHERAMSGDPLMEAGLTGLDLPSFPDPNPFMRGFGRTELTASETVRRHLYTLWLAATMLVETTYRHQPAEKYRWACDQLDLAMALLGRSR